MLRAAVCDDEKITLDYLLEIITREFDRHGIEAVIKPFLSGCGLLDAHAAVPFDVVFLDILMPDMDGFEAARAIREGSERVCIIFITAESSLVYDSFDFQPFDFIPKLPPNKIGTDSGSADANFLEERVGRTVKRLLPKAAQSKIISLSLPYGGKTDVAASDIRMIRSEGNIAQYDINGRDPIRIRQKLDDAETALSPLIFVRLHKSYIVNMRYVKRMIFPRLSAVMDDGTVIAISKARKKSAESAYIGYLRDFGGIAP